MKQIPCVVMADLNRYLDECERREAYQNAIDKIAAELLPYDIVPEFNPEEIGLFDTNLTILLNRSATPQSEEIARTELTDLFDQVGRRLAEKVFSQRMEYAAQIESLKRHEILMRRYA